MLVQAHAVPALAQDAGQRRFAHFDRLTPQVRAVQLQKVEGVEERLSLIPPMPKQLEGCHPLLVAANNFPIDQALPQLEVGHCLQTNR